MKNILDFLIEIQKLKEIPKTGWILMKVKNPETIVEHIFRLAFAIWLFGQKKSFKVEKLLKLALAHDLAEVYARDITPFFYWDGLERKKKENEKILLRGVRLSQKEKEKRWKMKLRKEKESFFKVTFSLNPDLKREIFSFWSDYANRISMEAKFVKQLDRIETLIQAIEYFGTKEITGGTSWWEGTEEIVEDPLLLEFLKTIQKKFYGKIYEKNEELENILDFLLKIGKLKRMPRLYWILRGVRNPETVAGHIFTLAIMAWIYGREKKELNIEKLLKMALCHELSAVYTGDTTPYDRILSKDEREGKKILERMLHLSRKEKRRIFLKDYQAEKKSLQKLTLKLKPSLKKEIFQLWKEYRMRSSPEGYFLTQLNTLAVLLQGLLYEKKDKSFSTTPLWEWALEICDDPICLRVMGEMKKRFY